MPSYMCDLVASLLNLLSFCLHPFSLTLIPSPLSRNDCAFEARNRRFALCTQQHHHQQQQLRATSGKSKNRPKHSCYEPRGGFFIPATTTALPTASSTSTSTSISERERGGFRQSTRRQGGRRFVVVTICRSCRRNSGQCHDRSFAILFWSCNGLASQQFNVEQE